MWSALLALVVACDFTPATVENSDIDNAVAINVAQHLVAIGIHQQRLTGRVAFAVGPNLARFELDQGSARESLSLCESTDHSDRVLRGHSTVGIHVVAVHKVRVPVKVAGQHKLVVRSEIHVCGEQDPGFQLLSSQFRPAQASLLGFFTQLTDASF